jgi:hypothetical protein
MCTIYYDVATHYNDDIIVIISNPLSSPYAARWKFDLSLMLFTANYNKYRLRRTSEENVI